MVPTGFTPLDNAESKAARHLPGDKFVEAGDQHAGANGVHRLTRNELGLDGHAQVETELQQQLVEVVIFTSTLLDVVDAFEQRVLQLFKIRLPGTDVRGVKVAYEILVFLSDFFAERRSIPPKDWR